MSRKGTSKRGSSEETELGVRVRRDLADWYVSVDYAGSSFFQTRDVGYAMNGPATRRQFLATTAAAALSIGGASSAAAGSTDWKRTYGGGYTERFNGVARTGENTFVAAGFLRREPSAGEGLGLGISEDGTQQWVRGYRSPHHHADEYGTETDEIAKTDAFETVVPTDGGGALLGGWFWPEDIDVGIPWVVRIDGNGWVQDQHLYEGIGRGTAHFNDGVGADEGTVFCGAVGGGTFGSFADSDGLVAKVSDDGTRAWTYAYRPATGRRSPDSRGTGSELTAAARRSDGGFVLVGEALEADEGDEPSRGWVLALDEGGAVEWQSRLSHRRGVRLQDVVRADGGGYVAVGRTASGTVGKDGYTSSSVERDGTGGIVTRVTSDGDQEWTRRFGDSPLYAVAPASGGYLLAGSRSGTAATVRVDPSGRTTEWTTLADADGPSAFTAATEGSGGSHLLVGFENGFDDEPGALVVRSSGSDATGDDPRDETSVVAVSGRDSEGNAAYVFTYDGTIEKTRGGIEASVNDLDVVSDGLVEGNVSNGADAYELAGTITSLVVHGPATLTVDGAERDPTDVAPPPAEPNVLFISGRETGGPGRYEFDVSGSVVKSRYRQASINEETATKDVVTDGHVEGRVQSGADAFRFSGSLTSFALDGDLAVSLNGRSIDPGDV